MTQNNPSPSIEERAKDYADSQFYPPIKAHHNAGAYNSCINDFKAGFIAGSSQGREGWVTEKPKFTDDCILITANLILDKWNYHAYEIIFSDGEDEKGCTAYYWGVFDLDGEEWGDLNDLAADKYKVVQTMKNPEKEINPILLDLP